MAKNWNDFTPQEKADWFDNSIKQFENASDSKLKEIIKARSKAKAGLKRHKKKHWWNH